MPRWDASSEVLRASDISSLLACASPLLDLRISVYLEYARYSWNPGIGTLHSRQGLRVLRFLALLALLMPVKEKNFWLETVTAPPVPPARDLPDTVDIAIVRGGFCGLSAARSLAKRGVNAAVLEAETFGWGASSRNGGMVLTGMKLPMPTLIKRYGRETVRKMFAASLESIECVERIVREENIDCDFSRCGHLEVACKQAHFDGYAESAALIQREFGHRRCIVSKSDLRGEIGSDIYFGGMVDETSAGLNPARYVAGLARAAQRAGACLHDHTRVGKIDAESNKGTRRFRVRTSKSTIAAREVILCSGSYTTEATPALRKRIIPIGSYIIATEVLPAALARELSPRNRMIYDSKHFLYYYRLTPDSRMLFGGRAAFFPETEDTVRQSAEILRRRMIHVYPQLRDTRVEYVWGGTLDFTLDVMPHAGKIDDMYFAAGFAGHGVAAATWFGMKLAGLICGEPNSIPFDGIPFPAAPTGLRSGRTWALPLAGAWYKILDIFT
jgi:glycine/D-amino acid oxidase-like deaminating enzyme